MNAAYRRAISVAEEVRGTRAKNVSQLPLLSPIWEGRKLTTACSALSLMIQAITTNVYLLLYPKPQYTRCLKDKAVLTEVWHELNTIPTETLSRNGRFYGGGLRKMEPNELMRTPARGIATLLTPYTSYQHLSLFD